MFKTITHHYKAIIIIAYLSLQSLIKKSTQGCSMDMFTIKLSLIITKLLLTYYLPTIYILRIPTYYVLQNYCYYHYIIHMASETVSHIIK